VVAADTGELGSIRQRHLGWMHANWLQSSNRIAHSHKFVPCWQALQTGTTTTTSGLKLLVLYCLTYCFRNLYLVMCLRYRQQRREGIEMRALLAWYFWPKTLGCSGSDATAAWSLKEKMEGWRNTYTASGAGMLIPVGVRWAKLGQWELFLTEAV